MLRNKHFGRSRYLPSERVLKQNYKHFLAVAHCLGVVDGIYSVIVFSDQASFKTPRPDNVVNDRANNCKSIVATIIPITLECNS
ncbi:hypothetical protein DIKCMJMK_03376 [Shewanella oneidensis]|nr:hypothetical protein [Shewanella oneidensis]